MTLVLDAGALTALAGPAARARLIELRRRGLWPPEVPSVVLTEALTGDHRRDFHLNRLLRSSLITDVGEPVARQAAALRTATGRAAAISAVDAVVVAYASTLPEPVVLTGDRRDLTDLASRAPQHVHVAPL